MEATVGDAGWRNQAWEDAKHGKTYVIFREDTQEDKFETTKQGRPIYKPIIVIEKIVPGDPLIRPVRPMRDSDKEEFPQEWARFEQKQKNQVAGTPLEAVTWLSRSQSMELKALNVFTVEMLAELPDALQQRLMGFGALREQAKRFLKASQDSAFTEKLDAKLKERDEEIAVLKAQMATILANQPATPQQQSAAGGSKKADRAAI